LSGGSDIEGEKIALWNGLKKGRFVEITERKIERDDRKVEKNIKGEDVAGEGDFDEV
jgi:hypothetical protein